MRGNRGAPDPVWIGRLLLGPAEDEDDEEQPAGDGDEGEPKVVTVGVEPFADDPFAPAGLAALAH